MVGRSWPRKSCPITCTCSCGWGRPTRQRRWCGHSRGRTARVLTPGVAAAAQPGEGPVVAVVLRRLGRRRLGVDGAPLYRAPVGRGDGVMRRSYVFRLRPTARQHTALAACVDAHRELYNAALQERRDAWSHSKTRVCYGDQSAQLTEIRSVRPDAGAVVVFESASYPFLRTPRRRENGVGSPADVDAFLGRGARESAWRWGPTLQGHVLLLRARRSEFRFP